MAARRALLGVSAAAAATAGIGSAYVALGAPEPPLADAPGRTSRPRPSRAARTSRRCARPGARPAGAARGQTPEASPSTF